MSLADFVIRKEDVMYQGVVATSVRGIALRDITELLHDHLVEMNHVFKLYEQEGDKNVAAMKGAEFALKLVNDVPDLVESFIVQATDETDTPALRETLRKLPIGLMVEIIRKIIDITTEDAGGAKKLLDNLMGMVRTIQPAMNDLPD